MLLRVKPLIFCSGHLGVSKKTYMNCAPWCIIKKKWCTIRPMVQRCSYPVVHDCLLGDADRQTAMHMSPLCNMHAWGKNIYNMGLCTMALSVPCQPSAQVVAQGPTFTPQIPSIPFKVLCKCLLRKLFLID